MSGDQGAELSVHRGFQLGEWLVQSSLNRLTRGDEVVQLEPKPMDLLVFLARHAGKVVSREALLDAVWAEEFVGEAVLRRALAALRRALGDDARSPTFIETIPKRGYRLIVEPVPAWQGAEQTEDTDSSSANALDHAPRAGEMVSHYRLLERLGGGGMGVVYRALDTTLGREVAVKTIADPAAVGPDRIVRFEREAKALAKLSHPNILEIHDFGSECGAPYAVTELLEGETLRQALDREGALGVERAVDIAGAIAAGLAAAHSRGIVHRDLKPSNILLTSDGGVKIVDFGLARDESDLVSETSASRDGGQTLTTPGVVLGTLGYLSPEQARGRRATPASDVFSLGCLLYEMLTGLAPFRRATDADTLSAVLREDPPPLGLEDRALRRRLERVLRRALDKRRERRYADGGELERALDEVQQWLAPQPVLSLRSLRRALGRPPVLAAVLLALSAGAVFVQRAVHHRFEVRRVLLEVIPEASRLAGEREFYAAFQLARRVEEVLGDDPRVASLWRDVAVEIPLEVEPRGAALSVRDYRDSESPWIHLGTSPGTVRAPRGFNRFRLESPGYETVEKAMDPVWLVEYTAGLDPVGTIPSGMIHVPPSTFGVWSSNLELSPYEHLPSARLSEFFIDRYEVTNAEYQRFVDAGGYATPEYWQHELRKDGQAVSWEAAMGELVDETGRPGPASWSFGTFPDGHGDDPVTGVSWYEAAAYAAFVGKELPTVYHWAVATNVYYGEFVIPLSNLEGSGLAPVGSFDGSLDSNGLYDMPGNAREWCFNASGDDRFILGGAWNDPTGRFGAPVARAPFDRSLANGFRCMAVPSHADDDRALWAPLPLIPAVDLERVAVLTDEVWGTWVDLVASEDLPLDSRIELTDDTPPHWRLEKVSFAAAYDGERMLAYLLLPENAEPPFHTVVFNNGGGSGVSSSRDGEGLVCLDKIDYIVRTGRAVVYPIYYGDYERGGGSPPRRLSTTAMVEAALRHYKDLDRTLDYLESRDDIDADRIAYLSFSRGSHPGLMASVLDPRIETVILLSGGAGGRNRTWSELVVNSARRTRLPVLMVTGRYDEHLRYERTQLPLFSILGTAPRHKRQVVLDCHHGLYPCRKEMIPEVLGWLDEHLGPVKTRGR